MRIKLLWMAFVIFLMFDIGIAAYIFFPKNNQKNVSKTLITTTPHQQTQTVPNNTVFNVTSTDPAIKVVSFDKDMLRKTLIQTSYLKANTKDTHVSKDGKTEKPIKNFNVIITAEKQPITQIMTDKQVVYSSYKDTYDSGTQTEAYLLYLSPDASKTLSDPILSKGMYYQLIDAILYDTVLDGQYPVTQEQKRIGFVESLAGDSTAFQLIKQL